LEPELHEEAVGEVNANLEAAYAPETRKSHAAAMRKLVAWVRQHDPEVIRPGVEDPLLGSPGARP
jgi:hypothetical protein